MVHKKQSGIIILVIFVAVFFSYSPSLRGGYFADDYQFKFHDTSLTWKAAFTTSHEYAYRPIEKSFLIVMKSLFDKNTMPIHAIQLFMHLSFAMMIMVWMEKQGFSRNCSLIAFCIMALSQSNSHAVSSLDTFSQISSTFLVYISLAFYFKAIKSGLKINPLVLSLLIFIISLFCKETALSVIPMIVIITLIKYRASQNNCKDTIIIVSSIMIYLLIAILFIVLRKYLNLLPAELGDDRYQIGLGLNIIVNLLMSIMQSTISHSSSELYFEIVNRRIFHIIVVLLFTSTLIAITVWGVFKSRKTKYVSALVILLPASLFPVIFLNHISELYVYNMMPLITIIMGIGIGGLLQDLKGVIRIAVLNIILIYTLWNAISVHTKSVQIYQNGVKAEEILNKLQQYYTLIPSNGKLILINPNTSRNTEYSIYRRTGFRLLENGLQEIHWRAERNDFVILLIMKKDLSQIDTCNSLIVDYKDGQIIKRN